MRKWGGGEKGGGDIWVRVGASQKSCGRMTQQAKKRVSFAVVFNFIHPTSYSCVRDSIAWYGMDDGVVQTRVARIVDRPIHQKQFSNGYHRTCTPLKN
jgi:hypothetical protein